MSRKGKHPSRTRSRKEPSMFEALAGLRNIHEKIADDAGLKRARVECRGCGQRREVDGAECLRRGWPQCCGETMGLVR